MRKESSTDVLYCTCDIVTHKKEGSPSHKKWSREKYSNNQRSKKEEAFHYYCSFLLLLLFVTNRPKCQAPGIRRLFRMYWSHCEITMPFFCLHPELFVTEVYFFHTAHIL